MLGFISSRDHYWRFSPSQTYNTIQAGLESAQNLSSDFVEWKYAAEITDTKLLIDNFAQILHIKVT